MVAYKLRVLTDLNDDFVRDIEICENQTFEDLHNFLKKNLNLNGKELASFHICDTDWNKHTEISLIDMVGENGKNRKKETVEDFFVMKDARIKDFIRETDQRIMYEYDFLNMFTFFIEVVEQEKTRKNVKYPRCTRKKGELSEDMFTKENENDEELARKLLQDFDEILKESNDYVSDYDNDI